MPAYPLLTINGVAMDDPDGRWGIAPEQELRGVPGRSNISVSIPGAPGVVVPAYVAREAFQFPVTLIVAGSGSTPDARATTLHQYLDALSFLFENNGEMYDVVYQNGPSSFWTARCRLLSSAVPAYVGSDAANITFLVDCPDGTWRAPEVQQTFITPLADPFTLTSLHGAGSEILDAKFLIRGPFTEFAIREPVTDQWVRVTETCNSSQWIRIDCGTYTATKLTSASFTAGGTDITNKVVNGGRGAATSWMRLIPRMNSSDPTSRDVKVACYFTGATNGTTSFSYAARKAS